MSFEDYFISKGSPEQLLEDLATYHAITKSYDHYVITDCLYMMESEIQEKYGLDSFAFQNNYNTFKRELEGKHETKKQIIYR